MSQCPTNTTLTRFLEDGLPAEELSALKAHIDQCADCRERLESQGVRQSRTDVASGSAAARRSDSLTPAELETVGHEAAAPLAGGGTSPLSAAPSGLTTAGEHAGEAAEALGFLKPAQRPGRLGRLGAYEIVSILGRGGMGVVLEAEDENLGRSVAIKVLSPQLAASESARKRCKREARAAAAVCHENVVTIHAVDEADGHPYLVMQLVGGVTLQDVLEKKGAFPAFRYRRYRFTIFSSISCRPDAFAAASPFSSMYFSRSSKPALPASTWAPMPLSQLA